MSYSLKFDAQPLRWLMVVAVGIVTFTFLVIFAKSLVDSRVEDIAITHANSDKNPLPHIVYEIFVIYPNGFLDILKYGISSQDDFITKDGNPRPEYQIPAIKRLQRFENCTVGYNILYRDVPGRIAAKVIEQQLVDAYFALHGEKPYLQHRPIPTELKISK